MLSIFILLFSAFLITALYFNSKSESRSVAEKLYPSGVSLISIASDVKVGSRETSSTPLAANTFVETQKAAKTATKNKRSSLRTNTLLRKMS